MSSLVRTGISRLFLCKKSDLSRTITSKTVRCLENRPPKPKPWDYKNKSYTILNYFFDRTTARFDDNSKIIVVEGPLAAGKSNLAKELAEELDMLYLPEANLDMVYTNIYGYDLKQLDPRLPESCRSFDVNNFMVTPRHQNATNFQMMQYRTKFSQYIDALAHVLSTGQGVVLDRCCYSDFVFAETMTAHGYMSKPALKSYYEMRENTIDELLMPHLIIYLDVPVKTVLQNVKKRCISYEQNSPVLTPNYLSTMEKFYKQKYLKEMSQHSELLIYDWSEGGEVEIVVEDVERIDFTFNKQLKKFKDWNIHLEDEWAVARYKYADRKNFLLSMFNIPMFHIPDMNIDPDDYETYYNILQEAPGQRYEIGYNADMGDTGVQFKILSKRSITLPLRERKIC